MKKKNANYAVIAVSVCAVCLVAVAAVLAVRATNNTPNIKAEITDNIGNSNSYYTPVSDEVSSSSVLSTLWNTTTQIYSSIFEPSSSASTIASTTKPTTTKPTTTIPVSQLVEEITVPEINEEITKHGDGDSAAAVTPSGKLPNDMSFAGLHKMGYSVIGTKDYIYNDDKSPDCFQKNFGYNYLYDAGANLIDFSIETTKIDFKYDGKAYRFQFWKGQYISGEIGTVGGEVGIYTRPENKVSALDHYDCAEEEDWLKMEMTVYWDEFDNGEYLPQFTRNYNDFWWSTGFVDGQLKNRRDSNSLRILCRITFKDVEQAEAFDDAMAKKGFTKVSDFSPYEIDTYKRYEKDVIFLWQNIR